MCWFVPGESILILRKQWAMSDLEFEPYEWLVEITQAIQANTTAIERIQQELAVTRANQQKLITAHNALSEQVLGRSQR